MCRPPCGLLAVVKVEVELIRETVEGWEQKVEEFTLVDCHTEWMKEN